MVFDAMHSNGVLRHHIPSGQVISHVDHSDVDVEGSSEGGGEICHVTSGHMAGNAIDSWQRKPLLKHEDNHDDDDDDEEDDGDVEAAKWETQVLDGRYTTGNGLEDSGRQTQQLLHARNGMVKINPPPPEKPKFPKEKWKTLVAFIFVFANWVLTTTSLAIVHERLPDRASSPPLPDVFFDLFPAQDWALDVSEIMIIVSVNVCLLTMFLHKHR